MTPAFSALATISAPEIVRQVHENFMDAGCDLITANTFSTTRHNMNSINRGNETKEFIVSSVEIAKKAIKKKVIRVKADSRLLELMKIGHVSIDD